ncbi:hypothetical protein N1031_08725 [Herbiconiux moechotypicola]|uniref:hypothetical protein n=1 Tax=Herbiconiux moechotypicola TaxID=637393 RepID=UPI00217CD51B|nr:hypothetical protein [Herbiconiux moechotypicola]MCS5729841.1 hypothetical protein [Herbiconiux moechotypicola]
MSPSVATIASSSPDQPYRSPLTSPKRIDRAGVHRRQLVRPARGVSRADGLVGPFAQLALRSAAEGLAPGTRSGTPA